MSATSILIGRTLSDARAHYRRDKSVPVGTALVAHPDHLRGCQHLGDGDVIYTDEAHLGPMFDRITEALRFITRRDSAA